jgi:SnoaL-like domain
MAGVVERLREARNGHDLEAMLECFASDYRSEQPAHPNRGFGGRDQVHKNWSAMFGAFPGIDAALLRNTSDGDLSWSEWRWSARGLKMAGVTVMGIKEDRISWARLYMEPVEEAGEDIDEAMRAITGRDAPGNEVPEDETGR